MRHFPSAATLAVLTAALPAQNPVLLADTAPGPVGAQIARLHGLGTAALFRSHVLGAGPMTIFRTTGTPASTVPTAIPGTAVHVPVGNRFLIQAPASSPATELRATDGHSGDVLVRTFANVQIHASGVLGDRLLFTADDGVAGPEPWITDGTPAGTRQIADLVPGSGGSGPLMFVRTGDQMCVLVANAAGQYAVQITDGTGPGTRPVAGLPVWTPPGPSWLPTMTAAGSRLFVAYPPGPFGAPWQLWVADLRAGTAQLLGAWSFSLPGTWIEGLFALGDRVVFDNYDATNGFEPWISDGTPAGTRMLVDLQPGPGSSFPRFAAGRPMLFYANLAAGGGLYVTDGTAAGTTLLRVTRTYSSVDPFGVFLRIAEDRVLFVEHDQLARRTDAFETDGTPAGTGLLQRDFGVLGVHLGRFVYVFDDGVHGAEPWSAPAGAVAAVVGTGCGAGLDEPTLGATAPRLGRTLTLRGRGSPAGATAALVVGSVPRTPIRIGSGCTSQVDLGMPVFPSWFVSPGPDWSLAIPLPADPSLQSLTLACQCVYFAGGIAASNGLHLTLSL